jgi:hypothetical protein
VRLSNVLVALIGIAPIDAFLGAIGLRVNLMPSLPSASIVLRTSRSNRVSSCTFA